MKKTRNHMNDKKSIFEKIETILSDSSIISFHNSLTDYLAFKKIPYSKKDHQQFIKQIEDILYNQIFLYAHLMFLNMEKNNNWGEAGEQQIRTSFCKNLLNIPAESNITYEEFQEFEKILTEDRKKLAIHTFSAQEAEDQYLNFSLTLLGKTLPAVKCHKFNQILHFCGSKLFLYSGKRAGWNPVILGEGIKKHFSEYDVLFISKELCRTPDNIGALAAMTAKTNVIIRGESLRTIFAQKWLPSIENDTSYYIQSNPFWNISQNIKQKTNKLYKAKNKEELLQIESTFINDMRETIACHELGHGIANHYLIPEENIAAAIATKKYGETIHTSLLEFFADFAPTTKKLCGPMQNMVNISKKDLNRAERMFYMYLSDVWFYDTPDEYMYLYSDLMVMILLKYIKPDQHINFEKLALDITLHKKESETPSLLERIIEMFIQETNALMDIPKQATYKLQTAKDYTYVKRLTIADDKHYNPTLDIKSYVYLSNFWTNMFGFVEKLSDSKEQLLSFIPIQEKSILKKIMILSCGRKKAESYNYDHRKFICDRMIELGFTSK